MPRSSAHDTIPPRPVGDDEAAHWFQWVHDFITLRGRFIDTPQIRFEKTTQGIRPILAPQPAGGPGVSVSLYRLKSLQDDYLTCRTWDGTTEGTTDVYIAKPPKLRHSITTETIEGVQYNYTYAAGPDTLNKYRVARIQGQTAEYERDLVTPEWLADDLIYAIGAKTLVQTGAETPTPGTDVNLLHLNVDGRAWAKHA